MYKRLADKYNLSFLFPKLMEEWDFQLNSSNDPKKIRPGSDLKVAWICSKNNKHKWDAIITNRTKKKNPTRCPFC